MIHRYYGLADARHCRKPRINCPAWLEPQSCVHAFLRSRQFGFASRLRGRGPDRAGRPVGRLCIYCARGSAAAPHACAGAALTGPGVQSDACASIALAAVRLRLTPARGRRKKAIPAKVADFCARGIAPTKIQFQQKLHDFCARGIATRKKRRAPVGAFARTCDDRPGTGRQRCICCARANWPCGQWPHPCHCEAKYPVIVNRG